MNTNSTTIAKSEHRISYAYASSESACRNGKAKTGTYVVKTADGEVPMPSYDEALAHVSSLGTSPNRWSMDHPFNARFLAKAA